MTENKKITLNIVATYGRSLYALVLGLFCGRWTLMALGEVDYGLMGVVGGLIVFIVFFNTLLAGAIGRFYAYSVGAATRAGNAEDGREECRRWFSIAVFIHTVVPTLLMLIGYPIGEWAVRNFLSIPVDRVEDCVWVLRFVCASCYISMLGIPFTAMYRAKQDIAELTIYDFATATINVFFLIYMINHPGVWLVRLAAWNCFIAILPTLIIMVRGYFKYSECRFRIAYAWDLSRIKQLVYFAGCQFVAALASMVQKQFVIVLVNKCLGPARNASMAIGNTVSGHALSLSTSMTGAFYPAMTNLAGAQRYEEMKAMLYRICKIAPIAVAIFAIPLIVECKEVFVLWLKNPPAYCEVLCSLLLFTAIVQRTTEGCWMSILARGIGVGVFQSVEAIAYISSFFLAWLFIALGSDISGVGYGMLAAECGAMVAKLYFTRKYGYFSIVRWLGEVIVPLLFSFGIPAACGYATRFYMAPSFVRVVVTALLIEATMLPCLWFFVLGPSERAYVTRKVQALKEKFLP